MNKKYVETRAKSNTDQPKKAEQAKAEPSQLLREAPKVMPKKEKIEDIAPTKDLIWEGMD